MLVTDKFFKSFQVLDHSFIVTLFSIIKMPERNSVVSGMLLTMASFRQ